MQNAPLILAIDTSLGPCSVAIVKGGEILAELSEPTPGSQSRLLVPMIEKALAQAGTSYPELTAVACTLGPGGFTGIRVGLATARAIALAAGKKLIGISTLETLAWGAHLQGGVLAIIDAHRGQFYVQRFNCNGILTPQSDALLVEERNLQALAHGAKRVQDVPKASDLGLLAAEKWASGEREFPTDPLYIRAPDAKLPQAAGLIVSGELTST